jgi:hypothetical protein
MLISLNVAALADATPEQRRERYASLDLRVVAHSKEELEVSGLFGTEMIYTCNPSPSLECLAKPAGERMVTTLTLGRTLTTRLGLARVERHAATSHHVGRLRRAAASPMIGK